LRSVYLDGEKNRRARYPDNAINNCKYTWYSFVPIVLFNQFKYFFNLFFLLIALSQILPPLRVGFLISFVAPLVFVLAVTMIKEFYDDRSRYLKDTEINVSPH
jgi:phospholipid-translocating ATPase